MSNPQGKGGFQDHPEIINRNGRPKEPLSELIRLKLEEEFELKKDGKVVDVKTRKEITADVLTRAAMNGNMRAIEVVLNRTEGNPTQPIDLGSSSLTKEEAERIDEFLSNVRKPKGSPNNNK